MGLPFNVHPISWGLKGKLRDKTKIEYEMEDGYDKDLALLKLDFNENTQAFKTANMELKHKHNLLTEEELDTYHVEQLPDGKEKHIKAFEVLHKHGHMTDEELEKEIFTIEEKPWVGIKLKPQCDEDMSVSFEIDYNPFFITFLEENGYEGDEDQVLDAYMADICKTGSMEEEIPYFNPATVLDSTNKA